MSDHSRALPERPSLRFLKIEAKRRLTAGEFATLHDAQLAIAREHGFPSWTALKDSVAEPENPALTQVRWVVGRFRDADDPAWQAPDRAEILDHFDDRFLSVMPIDTMVAALSGIPSKLREELVVTRADGFRVRAHLADLRVEALADEAEPHRLVSLRMYPVGGKVTDQRVGDPATAITGTPPDHAARIAEESLAELGLAGLVLAGGDPLWSVTRGWADLDSRQPIGPEQPFPIYGTTKLITATAVLCLVAQGKIDLDGPANRYLGHIRLADDTVTIRELLTHTGGVVSPTEQFADHAPDPAELLGTEVECIGRQETCTPSNGGYAVLAELIAHVTGETFPDAMTRLVLAPLDMRDSFFPTSWPGDNAITGYHLTDGEFEKAPTQVSTMPGAGGLWCTANDVARFGTAWATLLPAELAYEAVRPQVPQRAPGADMGLGWLVNPAKDLRGHPGTGPGFGVSLIVRHSTGVVSVAVTNRSVPIESVNARLVRPVA